MNIRVNCFLAATASTALMLAGIGALIPQPAEAAAQAAASAPVAADPIAVRGRYLVAITGCNDCHTPGYAETGGALPPRQWLTGSPVGFRGPWGTSYASNLRLTVQNISEEQWLTFARSRRLPPMPWFALRDMSDADLRAIYRFVRTLGPAGERSPSPVAPNEAVKTSYINFVPQNLSATAR